METVSQELGHTTVRLMMGDITRVPADAIANAANSALAGGGGVDGAIHRAGGPAIMEELDRVRPSAGCPTGSAVPTGAGRLPAQYVFHAVGPVWSGGDAGEAEALASCYVTCLRLADQREARVISFPSISTGIYGYPVEQAAQVAIRAVRHYLAETPASTVQEVLFVLFDRRTFDAYRAALGTEEPRAEG